MMATDSFLPATMPPTTASLDAMRDFASSEDKQVRRSTVADIPSRLGNRDRREWNSSMIATQEPRHLLDQNGFLGLDGNAERCGGPLGATGPALVLDEPSDRGRRAQSTALPWPKVLNSTRQLTANPSRWY